MLLVLIFHFFFYFSFVKNNFPFSSLNLYMHIYFSPLSVILSFSNWNKYSFWHTLSWSLCFLFSILEFQVLHTLFSFFSSFLLSFIIPFFPFLSFKHHFFLSNKLRNVLIWQFFILLYISLCKHIFFSFHKHYFSLTFSSKFFSYFSFLSVSMLLNFPPTKNTIS